MVGFIILKHNSISVLNGKETGKYWLDGDQEDPGKNQTEKDGRSGTQTTLG